MIERILWLAKIAPSTINVTDGEEVHEIAIFTVQIKGEDCNRATTKQTLRLHKRLNELKGVL